jgi:hypothetical protein
MYSARIERENKKFEEDNAVGSGKNWKKQITVPNPPKFYHKRTNRVKEPFKTPLANRHNCCPNSDLASVVQHNFGPANVLHYDLKSKRQNNRLVNIDPEMDYFDAIGMIHQHIMSLEI